jgi:hypothetical protein
MSAEGESREGKEASRSENGRSSRAGAFLRQETSRQVWANSVPLLPYQHRIPGGSRLVERTGTEVNMVLLRLLKRNNPSVKALVVWTGLEAGELMLGYEG